jgi:hypothetical protein
VCQKRRKWKDTVYWCDACDIRLCVECFWDYHTKLNFKVIKCYSFIVLIILLCQN